MFIDKSTVNELSNSFAMNVHAEKVYQVDSLNDLLSLPDVLRTPFYILGEGSNTLFIDQIAPIIIKPMFKGINVTESEEHFSIKVGANENWHKLVLHCSKNKYYGLENLALIPGSVGAAPVQNIGAYGVELSDFCDEVHWYEFETKQMRILNNEECRFNYRDSVFKQQLYNKGIITHIRLRLPKAWQPKMTYQGLDQLSVNSSPDDIMNQVIKLRQGKLPDPKSLPNAGSFFKNPIITIDQYNSLLLIYPNIPSYPQGDNVVKIAAGWLIDQAGLKGYRVIDVGVHVNQALVIVNYGKSTGKEIVVLAKYIQKCVYEKFEIMLNPEVKMVTAQGECLFEELTV